LARDTKPARRALQSKRFKWAMGAVEVLVEHYEEEALNISYNDIALHLNARGYTTITGKEWDKWSARRLKKRREYAQMVEIAIKTPESRRSW